MPRPILARKPATARAAAIASDDTNSRKSKGTTATTVAGNVPEGKSGAAQVAAKAVGRITRITRAGRKLGLDRLEGVLNEEKEGCMEEKVAEDEHGDGISNSAGGKRATRSLVQKEGSVIQHKRNKSSSSRVDVEETTNAVVKRTTRSRATKAAVSRPTRSPRVPGSEGGDRRTTRTGKEREKITVVPTVPAKAKNQDKGKQREVEEFNQELLPSSPPQALPSETVPDKLDELDDVSSTSSTYGDENSLPPPLAQSTPKPTTTLPVTPPKPKIRAAEFGSDEGYTPPQATKGLGAGPAGSSSPLRMSPVRRRLWESSSIASSPLQSSSPLHLNELPKTAVDVLEGPLGFDIYEDSNISPAHATLSHFADVDGRGDGAAANILRTPKKNKPLMTKKRTSSGGKKTPDGKIVEETDSEASQSDSCKSISSESSGEETETPAVQEAKPKRQKRAQQQPKPQQLSTKDLLDLAPRRRGGGSRAKRNQTPIVVDDDLGEDLTLELEDELAGVMKRRATKKRNAVTKGRKASSKTAGVNTSKSRVNAKATKSKRNTSNSTGDTPVKTAGAARRKSIPQLTDSSVLRSVQKTYTRTRKADGNDSDSTVTPRRGDKENSLSVEPSSGLNTEAEDITREGKLKLQAIKEKFAEVDKWEMVFEDVELLSSSSA